MRYVWLCTQVTRYIRLYIQVKSSSTYISAPWLNDMFGSTYMSSDKFGSIYKLSDTFDYKHKQCDTFCSTHQSRDKFGSEHKSRDMFGTGHKSRDYVRFDSLLLYYIHPVHF